MRDGSLGWPCFPSSLGRTGWARFRRACPLLDGRTRDVRLGAFTVGPIDLLVNPPEAADMPLRKLWWAPDSPDGPAATISVLVEGPNDYRKNYDFGSAVAGSGDPMYPGGIDIPAPGAYTISGEAGTSRSCFRVVTR